jgi:ABC-type transport system involved in multi-copper enzyme maturation permease subunit
MTATWRTLLFAREIRAMAGPVLTLEMLRGGRRLRNYTLRWCYAGWLVLQFLVLSSGFLIAQAVFPLNAGIAPEAGRYYVEVVVNQQFLFLVLVTPAVLAGAVADEKSKGTLQYLIVADLTVGEILLGKLCARAALIGSLALLPLPFLCLAAPFAGLDGLGLLILAGCTASVILCLGALGLLASVWSKQTRNAVVGLYCCLTVGYLAIQMLAGNFAWAEGLAHSLDPLYPLALEEIPDDLLTRGERLLAWLIPWLCLGASSFALAVWRMLPAYLSQLESSGVKRQRWWTARRPSVRRNPVLWKERYVEGIAPLPLLRTLPTWLAVLGVFLLTILAYGWMVAEYLRFDLVLGSIHGLGDVEFRVLLDHLLRLSIPIEEFVWRSICVLLIAGLVVGIRCSGAVTGERERKTWEALLLTPMEVRQLIRGKFWGILGATTPYLIAFSVPALAFSVFGGGAAVFLTTVFLGVTWLGMAYVGAAGIWCSVRCKSSWRSLLMTLMLAYVGGVLLYCVASPFIAMVWFILMLVITLANWLLGGTGVGPTGMATFSEQFAVALAIGLGVAFAVAAWRFLASAEYRVGVLERTKHWRRPPRRRPRRPRYAEDD